MKQNCKINAQKSTSNTCVHARKWLLLKEATIYQVTTMPATSKNVLFPCRNHLLTSGADDPTLWLSPECQRVKGQPRGGQQYRWLAGGYDLENGTHLEVASMVVTGTWWIVPFLKSFNEGRWSIKQGHPLRMIATKCDELKWSHSLYMYKHLNAILKSWFMNYTSFQTKYLSNKIQDLLTIS